LVEKCGMAEHRIVAAVMGGGRIGVIEQEVPPLRAGTVRVAVGNSLVSAGTELGGWAAFAARRGEPAGEGKPRAFGYSNAGVVEAVGEGVERFAVGDRVACVGNGYALHTNLAVVPQNLCVLLPEEVTFARSAYAMLAATAMHALRRGEPELGEYAAVVGLGVLGQLTAQLYQLAGNDVIGWDLFARRVAIARQCGLRAAVQVGEEYPVAATEAFTRGAGLDAAVFAMAGEADEPMRAIEACMRRTPDGHATGRIIVVGGIRFAYTSTLTNVDIRRASRTGPGYHDEPWETGRDYPPVLVRWSTQTNLRLCMRLIAEGKLNVDALTTHTIPLADAEAGVAAILDTPEEVLGVVFEN